MTRFGKVTDGMLDWLTDNVMPAILLVLLAGILAVVVVAVWALATGNYDGAPTCAAGYQAVKVESHENVNVLVGKVIVPTPSIVTRWVCVEKTQ